MEDPEGAADDSLIALTTHFAQVQFRLKQIVSADPEEKESLLKDLEEFAFRSCTHYDTAAAGENGSTEFQRRQRNEVMKQLKDQLEELEQCAQETSNSEGARREGGGPASLAEKQQIIIDELRRRFDVQFGDLGNMSHEEVRENAERAVHEIVDPMKSKEELVTRLHTQVQDLERYITFLQANRSQLQSPSCHTPSGLTPSSSSGHTPSPTPTPTPSPPSTRRRVRFAEPLQSGDPDDTLTPSSRPVLDRETQPVPDYRFSLTQQLDGVTCTMDSSMVEWEQRGALRMADRQKLHQPEGMDDMTLGVLVMRKTLALMQVITLWQCGGSFHCLPRYVMDGKKKRYHTILHSLELIVDKIAIFTTALNDPETDVEDCIALETNLHEAVSMTLADSLRLLLENGLLEGGDAVSWEGGCVPAWRMRRKVEHAECGAWKVFMHYYNLKNGKTFSKRPDQLLSSAFALPVDNQASIKKTLLSTIHKVETTYSKCSHRSKDTKFRALISEGFNIGHLADWFRAIATHPSVAEDLYSVSSFLATTNFRPAIVCLERLKDNPPCQPVELPQDYYQCTQVFN